MKKHILLLTLSLASVAALSAQTVSFDLQGLAGPGLLPGNEVPTVTSTASGGEIGSGITFDEATNILSINIGWGSLNGFTDLSGDATGAHIHGTADQSSTAGVVVNFGTSPAFTFDPSATGGSVVGSIDITTTSIDPTDLLGGLYYINIHTAANPGGQIRGNLTFAAIPEPSTLGLLVGLSGLAIMAGRRRR